MTDFQFNDGSSNIRRSVRPRRKTFADRLIAWGIVKDEAQANLVLIAFIVVAFIAIIIININTFSSPAPAPIPDELTEGNI